VRHTHDGLTLWTDTPDAPATARSVTVGVSPAHPSNTVEVRYRVDGGPERVARARPLTGGAARYFRAELPEARPGARVDVLPTLLCAGRRCPEAGGADALALVHEPTPIAAVAEAEGAALPTGERFGVTLEFLATVWVTLRAPEVIGEVPQGLRMNYFITDGGCAGPRLNARILPEGGDWMLIQRDGVAIPGVRTTWKTDDGALLYGEYSGVFELGPDGYANSLAGRYPELPVVQLAPRFVTTDHRYAWLNRKQLLGVGAVQMNRLRVEYDLYATGTGPHRG
jgi:hypothetical protein